MRNVGIIVQDEAGRVLYEVEFPPYMPVFNPVIVTAGSSLESSLGSAFGSAFEIVEIRFRPVEEGLGSLEEASIISPQPVREAPCALEKRVERRLLDIKRRKN